MSSGHIITQRRKCMGLTQEKLAEQINVSRQTIAMWETSKQFPSDSVAIIAARFLDIPEEELFEQLRWDRLHQRVNQLEKQYDATITVKPAKEGQQMMGLLKNATQTIDDVTITVTRIYKSIYWVDPIHGKTHGIYVTGPYDIRMYHTDKKLIVHLLRENRNPRMNLTFSRIYAEDNLGNHFNSGGSGGAEDESVGEYAYRFAAHFEYPSPQASSFILHYDVVNGHEDECDALLFEDVPIDGEGITRTFNDDVITYNGVHWHKRENLPDSCQIHLVHNMAREVRHVGLAAITDNLGNQYGSTGGGSWGNNKDVFFENFKKAIDPKATSISFKYLFARKIFTFELRDLPLPS